MSATYQPLRGVRVLDIGILLPAALTSVKLVALGADVVKVELPGVGDRLRYAPNFAPDGTSAQHMTQNRGKRSIALDLRRSEDKALFLQLAVKADVIVENQLPGFWAKQGIDFAAMREARPALIVCSVTGFGQTGPLARLPAHGLNMDAIADGVNLTWKDGVPKLGWSFCSWGTEIGADHAGMAICAALLEVERSGQGAWIDISCWDALVEAHRAELALNTLTRRRFSGHDTVLGALYNTYLSRDGKPVLLGALEPKFWRNFCNGVGREDLIEQHGGGEMEFGEDNDLLERELRSIFASADAEEWDRRFVAWDCPGGTVLEIPEVMELPHFEARGIVEGEAGSWPNVASPIRWHHVEERAGSGMANPSEIDGDRESILRDWLESGGDP